MNSAEPVEHYATLFDSHYLPLGLCLYQSLEQHGRPFRLWIVAMDDACADALEKLRLASVTVVRLTEIESAALRDVKRTRSVGEYCWTLTPFLPSHVFAQAPDAQRVTYVDADLYFFAPPAVLLEEFAASGKHVLITEHAFAPEYAANLRFGRFCVQFVTFCNTAPARRLLEWWQARCLEWCYAREEDDKFGDQKYLDQWPQLFGSEVHVLKQTERTLAPWNVAHASRRASPVRPVFYHFHSLRIVSPSRVVLYHAYRTGHDNRWIYERYIGALRAAAARLRDLGIPVIGRPAMGGRLGRIRLAWEVLRGRAAEAALWKITVVTVCRNSATSIEATVQSVLAQDYPDFEYVVVDGASTDGTLEVLRKYASRIGTLVSDPDSGVYNAMNKGAGLATGDYLLFMNAGDVFAASVVLSRVAAAADADVVYGDFEYASGPRRGRVSADIDRGVFNHQCVFYRRALHATYGEYVDVSGLTAADYLFFMRLRATGRVSFKKIDLVFSKVDPNGMSAGLQTFLQVNLADGLLQRRGRYAVAWRIAIHPIYHFFRRLLRGFR